MNQPDLDLFLTSSSKKIGKIISKEKLDSVTNEVYLLKSQKGSFVLKIINSDKKNSEDLDFLIIKKIGCEYFRKIVDNFSAKNGKKALLLEYIEGKMLSSYFYEKRTLPKNLFNQLDNFIKDISQIETEKFGVINRKFRGNYNNWSDFLIDKIDNYLDVIGNSVNISNSARQKLLGFAEDIKNVKSALIPVDVNLSNFIIQKEEILKVLDIGSYLAGDYLTPYGLLLAHSWKSSLSDLIINHFVNDKRRLHFYSCIEMLAIISFTKKFYPQRLIDIKPFGLDILALDIFKQNIDLF